MFTVSTVLNFAQENILLVAALNIGECMKLNAEGMALFVFSKADNSPMTSLINVLCYKSDAGAGKGNNMNKTGFSSIQFFSEVCTL